MGTLGIPSDWLIDWSRWFSSGYEGNKGRVSVSHETSLTSAAWWYAINRITGNVGQMPIEPRQKLKKGGAKVASQHAAWKLFRLRPNGYQTPFILKAQVQSHASLWGNGRIAIIRENGKPVELIPLMPDRTRTILFEGEKYHLTRPFTNERIEQWDWARLKDDKGVIILSDADVLHILGFSFDGVEGKSLVQMARESLLADLAGQRHAANQSDKAFTGKLMLQAPVGQFQKEDEAAEFLKNFRETHSTEGDSEVVGLLRRGVTANVLTMSNIDAQFIEQRRHARQEAALWFCLESIIGDDTSKSYNTEEQKQLAYLKNCLNPILEKWEQECNLKLLTEKEQEGLQYYFKFNPGVLLRTDMQTTIATLGNAIVHRIYNANEAREKLDDAPYEGGDIYENPAINTGSPGQSAQKESLNQRSTAKNRLLHMVAIEMKRVIGFAEAGDFVGRVEKFYDRWNGKLLEVVEEIDGDVSAVCDYCKERLQECLTVAGEAKTNRELVEKLDAVMDHWPQIAERKLCNAI